jgi:hypothetical protein
LDLNLSIRRFNLLPFKSTAFIHGSKKKNSIQLHREYFCWVSRGHAALTRRLRRTADGEQGAFWLTLLLQHLRRLYIGSTFAAT